MSQGRQVQLYPLALGLQLLAVLLDLHHGDRDAVGWERQRRGRLGRAIGRSEDNTAAERGMELVSFTSCPSGPSHLVIEMVSAWVCGMGWRGRETMGLMETPLVTLATPLATPSLSMI